jgi:hypothetical protein
MPQSTAVSTAAKTLLYQSLMVEWVKYIAKPITTTSAPQNNQSQRDFPPLLPPEALAFLAI